VFVPADSVSGNEHFLFHLKGGYLVGVMNRVLIWAIVFILLAPCGAHAADIVFSGGLQRVTSATMIIRLDDGATIETRLPKSRDLTAAAIVARFKLADRVQITCTGVNTRNVGGPFFELKKLQYLRPASADELKQITTSISWRREENLLKHPEPPARAASGPSAEQSAFEHARQVGLDRARSLPSFVADELAKRWTARQDNPAWELLETIESEITFKGSEPVRQNIRINGKPWKKPGDPVNWSADFGVELKQVFGIACPNTFEFDGRQEVRGQQLLVYRFSSPPDGCFGWSVWDGKRYIPARKGRILIEEPTGNLLQYEEEATEYPSGFGIVSVKETIQSGYVRFGESTFLVPIGYEYFITFPSGDQWHVIAEFSNHRQFQSSVNLTFQQEQ
jgi:hypothetical protein